MKRGVQLLAVVALLMCSLTYAADPPKRVWLRLGDSPAVLTEAQALEVLASGACTVRYTTQAYAPTVIGIVVGGQVPPPAADPLLQPFKTAYAEEKAADKAADVKALASVYRKGVTLVADPALKTYGDVFDRLYAEVKAAGAAGKVMGVQRAVRVALVGEDGAGGLLGTELAVDLTSASRARAAEAFTRIARLLEATP